MDGETEPTNKISFLKSTLNLYRESIKNVPILKYSWIIVATICILSLTAYFKLKNTDVFLYAFVVLIISFFGFVFSLLTKTNDTGIKIALYILVYAIVVTMATAVCSFGYFIVENKPDFYKRYFPDQTKPQTDTTSKRDKNIEETATKDKKEERKSGHSDKELEADTVLSKPAKPIVEKNGFYETGPSSAYLVYNGTKLLFKKVIGNHTKLSYASPPYYISQGPLSNQFLIDFANSHSCRTPTPSNNLKNVPIESIYFDDAKGISEMLGLDIPDMFQIVNADLSKTISLGNYQELFYYEGDSSSNSPIFGQSSLGEIYINLSQPNIRYLADKYRAEVKGNLVGYCPRGRIRLVKNIQ